MQVKYAYAKMLINRLIYRIHDRQLVKFASRYLKGKLIDIGCGVKPYATLLASYVDVSSWR